MKNRIKELRLKKKINQATLAEYVGVSQNTISYWEQGKYEPDMKTLQKLADYFDVTTDYLLGRETKEAADLTIDGKHNVIKIAARDGGVTERKLTDAQLALLKAMLDQLPDADNDEL